MIKYSSLVSSNDNFQSSVNLQFDLNKLNKINSYIPTQQSVIILKRYLNAVYNTKYNEDNATVLIGPYGRGKSHLLLVLSAIISGKAEQADGLIKGISEIDEEAGRLAEMILERKKPLLPVIINSSYSDINQSFTIALREALEREELNDFFPETYFDAALSMIDTWKKSYEKAYSDFAKLLKKRKSTPDKLRRGLKKCSREDYELFCGIYPEITNGARFNPMQDTDVVRMYSKVSEALCEQKNYGGIFIIFDEFSKFLESSASLRNMQNFKLIQDFAELAARSGADQLHICCITHKEILDYSQSDSFRTVDGRFKKIYFVASSEQSYELAANAMRHTKKFEAFYEQHREQFSAADQAAYRTGIFSDIDEDIFENVIVKKCFPLHPVTVYALIKVSELIGQNERTLFTFLSQSGEHTLSEFLDTERDEDGLCLLTCDVIFDYFSELLRAAIFDPSVHSAWAKANTALKQTKDVCRQKIIKAVAVINIINEEKFRPVSNHIKAAVNMSDSEYSFAMEQLTREHILALRRDGEYAFLTPNGVDIRRTIRNYIEQGAVKTDRAAVLRSAYSVPYILPRQYNSDRCMMRYFRTAFMEAKDLRNYSGDLSELRNGADGLIIYLITDTPEETYHLDEKLEQLGTGENIIVCVSECWADNDLLCEYAAACMLENSRESDDPHFHEELMIYKDDLFKSIRGAANRIYNPSNPQTAYYTCRRCLLDVTKPMLLNRELSLICSEYYNRTPVINNEMINKNHLTAPIRKARAKVIDHILAHAGDIPEMEGAGPEVSIFRSAVMAAGLDSGNADNEYISEVLGIIRRIINTGENAAVSFSEFFDVLTASPYGMRMGVIPVYIAYEMRTCLDRTVICMKNKEIRLTGEAFNNISADPASYTFCIEEGTSERNDYVSAVINRFGTDDVMSSANRCSKAVSLMQTWFRGLPKFARTHMFEYGSEKTETGKKLFKFRRKLLMYDLNPHEFLFEYIPEVFGCFDYSELAVRVSEFADSEEAFIPDFRKYMISAVRKCFGGNIGGSLFTLMKDWYERLSDAAKKNIFDADTNAVLRFIASNTVYDDDYVISSLAKAVTMLAIEDWSDETADIFIGDIKRIISAAENYDAAGSDGNISLSIDIGGTKYEKNLADAEISAIAETALNNIEDILDDYGDAITAQERISVLLRILREEIDRM